MKFKNDTKVRVWFVTPWLEEPLEPGEEIELRHPAAERMGQTFDVDLVWVESDEDTRITRTTANPMKADPLTPTVTPNPATSAEPTLGEPNGKRRE